MTVATPATAPVLRTSVRTLGSVLWRDIFVTWRELVPFLLQVVVQPFFTLFIFGKVLTSMGYVGGDYTAILLPGVVALNGFLGALQNTTMPLIMDFSWTREIEDRLLAPLPISLVCIEKILFGAMRGIVAALVMVPVGFLILDNVSWPASTWLPVAGIVILGSIVGGTIGMTIGTLVTPRRINILFAVILMPLMFTGSTQFPWRGLEHIRWFQVVCALNPLTYVSEGMRAELVPAVPHIPMWINLVVMVAAIVVFGTIGIKGFMRRALD
jgi:ABC-2 type transport system permease protein